MKFVSLFASLFVVVTTMGCGTVHEYPLDPSDTAVVKTKNGNVVVRGDGQVWGPGLHTVPAPVQQEIVVQQQPAQAPVVVVKPPAVVPSEPKIVYEDLSPQAESPLKNGSYPVAKIKVYCGYCRAFYREVEVELRPHTKVRVEFNCSSCHHDVNEGLFQKMRYEEKPRIYHPNMRAMNVPIGQSTLPPDPVRQSETHFSANFNGLNSVEYHHEQGTRNSVERQITPWGQYERIEQQPYNRTDYSSRPPEVFVPSLVSDYRAFGNGGPIASYGFNGGSNGTHWSGDGGGTHWSGGY